MNGMSHQPSQENPNFGTADFFDLQAFALRLEDFISTERHFVPGSLVVSLSAPFGTGKTTFLTMWEKDLNTRRTLDPNLPMPLILNAWETDYAGEPLLALLSAITKIVALLKPKTASSESQKKLIEASKDVANFALSVANSFVAQTTGVDAIKAGEYVEKKKEHRKTTSEQQDLLSTFQKKEKALASLKEALSSFFAHEGNTAIFLVDELDRCRPDYAISYLETIKHIFDIPGLTFLLAVDRTQLECSAKALFGRDLNFKEYYRKFVHRNIQLPLPNKQGIQKMVSAYISKHFDDLMSHSAQKGARIEKQHVAETIRFLVSTLKLTARQTQEIFRIVAHLTQRKDLNTQNFHEVIANSLVFLTALSVGEPEFFDKFLHRTFTTADLKKIIDQLFPDEEQKNWWIFLILTGGIANQHKKGDLDQILQECLDMELLDKSHDIESLRRRSYSFYQSWGINSSFQSLAERIVELKAFGTN